MYFHPYFAIIATLLLLSSPCLSATIPSINDHLDPKCPPGWHPGFETSVFQYNVPAEKFYNKMGSFHRSEWYTGPLNSTHEKDNTVGATRSGVFAAQFYTERLVGFTRSSSQLTLRYVLDKGPVDFGGVKFNSYTEELRIASICGGSATYITFTSIYCERRPGRGYAFYYNLRRDAVGAVADQLNALVFAGSCSEGKS